MTAQLKHIFTTNAEGNLVITDTTPEQRIILMTGIIDGVTGSSPVATTTARKPLKIKGFRVFFLPVFETIFNGKNGFMPERHPLE